MPISYLGQSLGPGWGLSSVAICAGRSIDCLGKPRGRYPGFRECRKHAPSGIGGTMAVTQEHRASPMLKRMKRATLAIVLLVACSAVTGHDAWSQTSRTIKIVVPFAPGRGVDIV